MSDRKIGHLRSQSGFTLAELCIAVALICIISGFAILGLNAIQTGMRADKAMYQLVDGLRSGREAAITQRRAVEVRFPDDDTIQLVRLEVPNGETPLRSISLSGNYRFVLFGDIPDTPDSFGNASAVDFGGESLTFISDGTLVDAQGNPINGTVFLGLENHPETARAITVLGATGQIRSYRWSEDLDSWIF